MLGWWMIKFTIPDSPKPLKRHRSTRTGRMYDPSSKDKKDIWLQIEKFKPKTPLVGDIMLKLTFYMPRPKSHYRSGKYKHLLKDNMPVRHRNKPDLDNLVKMVSYIIQPQMIVDDSQICILLAEKEYGQPRTEVVIEEI